MVADEFGNCIKGVRVQKIVATLICGLWLMTDAVTADPAKLIVFPLSGASQSSDAWVGEGVSLSLAGQLADSGISVVPQGEMEDMLEENGLPIGVSLSRGSMIHVAGSAAADFAVLGSFTGNANNLKLSARLLNMKTLKSTSDLTVSGALTTLPEMENELAWMIYSSIGVPQNLSREKFRERTRKIPNTSYASYIQSLHTFSETKQIQLLEKALKDHPDFPEANLQMGQLYYQKHDYVSALKHLQHGRNISGASLDSEFLIGTCHLQSGSVAEAIKTYTQILDRVRRPETLNNLAVAHVRDKNNTLALQTLSEAREAEPTDSTIAMNLAITHYLTGNPRIALDSLRDAIKAHPGNGMLYFISSFLEKLSGNESQAAEDAARAMRLGIQVEKLQREEPKTWLRIIPHWFSQDEEDDSYNNGKNGED